jgi:hypothetical protein
MKIVLALLSAVLLSGCISTQSYIDPTLPVLRVEDLQPVASPQPVRLVYEFRTKGAQNARATEYTKPIVTETVTKSGLFSGVSDAAGARTLTITIENVFQDDAYSKGFKTGLTFGLSGTVVTDGYICTAVYEAPGRPAITKTVNHALHTTVGNHEGPKGLKPMKQDEAIPEIMRQLILNALQALRNDGL